MQNAPECTKTKPTLDQLMSKIEDRVEAYGQWKQQWKWNHLMSTSLYREHIDGGTSLLGHAHASKRETYTKVEK